MTWSPCYLDNRILMIGSLNVDCMSYPFIVLISLFLPSPPVYFGYKNCWKINMDNFKVWVIPEILSWYCFLVSALVFYVSSYPLLIVLQSPCSYTGKGDFVEAGPRQVLGQNLVTIDFFPQYAFFDFDIEIWQSFYFSAYFILLNILTFKHMSI